MDAWLIGKSILIGLAIAAPVGPMSMLCIHRTLERGQPAGLVFGAGIAAADGTYAAVAAFGITAVSSALLAGTAWIRLLGALLLVYLGLRIALARPDARPATSVAASGIEAFATAYGLTITNPPTILYFASVFASFSPLSSMLQAAGFSAGVFAGSMMWWVVLTSVVARSAHALQPPVMIWINRGSGALLIVFACYTLFSVAVSA
jgi:putative LysE/RhtB family amino acid efflux pump